MGPWWDQKLAAECQSVRCVPHFIEGFAIEKCQLHQTMCLVTQLIYILPQAPGTCWIAVVTSSSPSAGHMWRSTSINSPFCKWMLYDLWLYCWDWVGFHGHFAAITFSCPTEQLDLMKWVRNLESWLCLFSADLPWTNNLTSLSLFLQV